MFYYEIFKKSGGEILNCRLEFKMFPGRKNRIPLYWNQLQNQG
jgi:hypothetical protein